MATRVKKVCISLPQESLNQLDWLCQNVLHSPVSASFSGIIQVVIGLAYYKYYVEFNREPLRNE